MSSNNGRSVIETIEEWDVKIISNHCKRKDLYKVTWFVPNGKRINQKDHVLLDKR